MNFYKKVLDFKAIGAAARKYRERKGVTQLALEAFLQLPQSSVCKLEAGERTVFGRSWDEKFYSDFQHGVDEVAKVNAEIERLKKAKGI